MVILVGQWRKLSGDVVVNPGSSVGADRFVQSEKDVRVWKTSLLMFDGEHEAGDLAEDLTLEEILAKLLKANVHESVQPET